MENYNNEGFDSQVSNRRDYGSERNSERDYSSGYSQAGRKLRHRKNRTNESESSSNYQSNDYHSFSRSPYRQEGQSGQRSFSDRRGPGYGERKSYGGSRYSDSGRGYGDRRPAQRRPFGDQDDYRRSGEGRRYSDENGERRGFSSGRPAGKRNFQGARKGAPSPARGRRPGGPAVKNTKRQPDAALAGINRMLSRKPQINDNMLSDNDMVNIPVKEEVRLNKFIANSGVCSRREADNLILAGVVTVNGKLVTELGTKVNIYTDDVRFNGERLRGEEKVYIVMNKPKGFVTTASDPHADKTVMDLLKSCTARVFPVGRLDKNTTGVLMFTNDGEIAEKLTHPSYDKKKIYQVTLDKDLSSEDFGRIMGGIELADGVIAADELEYIDDKDHRKLGIEIHSGKNRIVRRIFESLGYSVKALDRVYFAGLTKKGLKRGAWRYLSQGEVNILKMGAYV